MKILTSYVSMIRSMLVIAALLPALVLAHPLGQNAFNREAGISVAADRIKLHYLLDLAEIPTIAASEQADADHDGIVTDAEWDAYAARWAQGLVDELALQVDGKRIGLQLAGQRWAIAAAASGLSTLRMQAEFEVPLTLAAKPLQLDYQDRTPADRLGWKEVWIAAESGAALADATAPVRDRSRNLTDFALHDGETPPDQLTATARISVGPATSNIDQAASLQPATIARSDANASSVKPAAQRSIVWSFFRLGLHHIATGWDHLMFLLGLLLLSGNLRQLFKTVTAFTLAHSVTLALAAEGLVHPPGSWVEALIALTIAYVGIVAMLWKERRHGVYLAFGFGLIHGFGFAGALAESLGSNQSIRLIGLVSFNLGIEAFQLMLVCSIFPVLQALQRYSWSGPFRSLLAGSVFLAGSSWFLLRTVGDGGWTFAGIIVAATAAIWIALRRGRARPLRRGLLGATVFE